ncbi:hypothetical protein GQ42DRAFT_160612, partial [Ramicandelaber brevisporus]
MNFDFTSHAEKPPDHWRTAFQPRQLRLLDLPWELLEEISLHLSIRQAAGVLTVSKAFHEVAATRIWRNLDALWYDLMKLIPVSAWQRYGHLVRQTHVAFWDNPSRLIPLSAIPNVVQLSIRLNRFEEVFTNMTDILLPHLQRIKLYGKRKYRAGNEVVDWLTEIKERGRYMEVEWDMTYVNNDGLAYICRLAERLVDLGVHTFNISLADTPSRIPADVSALAPTVNSLELTAAGRCTILNNSYSFPRLTKLSVAFNSYGPRNSLCGFDSFTPVRFAALRCLKMDCTRNYEDGFNGIFANEWPQITKFTLEYCRQRNVFEQAIRQLPGVTHLELEKCKFLARLEVMAECLPRLERLTFSLSAGTRMDNANPPKAVFPNLIELECVQMPPRNGPLVTNLDYLSVAIHCAPNLQSMYFDPAKLGADIKAVFEGRVNLSVRMITLGSCVEHNSLCAFLALFPNTRRLAMINYSNKGINAIKKMHPEVTAYRVIKRA